MFQSKTLMWELFVVRLKREINILLYKKKKSAVWAAMEKKKNRETYRSYFPVNN